MKDWDDDKQTIKNNIEEELNLLTSETEKLFLIAEVMKNLDKDKLPAMVRKNLDF